MIMISKTQASDVKVSSLFVKIYNAVSSNFRSIVLFSKKAVLFSNNISILNLLVIYIFWSNDES